LGAATATVKHTWQLHSKLKPLLFMNFAAELCGSCKEPKHEKSAAKSRKRHAATPELHLGAATGAVRHTWQRHGKPEPLLLMQFTIELCNLCAEPAQKKYEQQKVVRDMEPHQNCTWERRQQSGTSSSVIYHSVCVCVCLCVCLQVYSLKRSEYALPPNKTNCNRNIPQQPALLSVRGGIQAQCQNCSVITSQKHKKRGIKHMIPVFKITKAMIRDSVERMKTMPCDTG
jgi:hypothetical protein